MHENIVFTMDFSLLKSDSEHVYFSRVIYPTDSLSDFNNHFHNHRLRNQDDPKWA